MCGIFGVAFADPTRPLDVEAAVASLGPRGPDARNVVRGPGFVFGHARLAVIDLSPGGAQPMMSDDGRTIVVFNGEIYNHRELRSELEREGYIFRSRSDTEAILIGFKAWGVDVVRRLDGMFAIGIFDVTARKMFLARDRTGKKPIFYTFEGGELRFASEPKALFSAGTKAEVDASSLPLLLSMGYVPAPFSSYRGVSQLPPASTLELEKGGEPRIHRYWSPNFLAPPRRTSVPDAAREVRRLVIEAVRRRLESDVPLGAFLSGGLDSTIVVGVMARILGCKVKTFSLGFSGDPRYDETAYAREAAAAFGTDHEEFIVDQTLTLDLLDDLVRAHDAPFGDSSAVPMSIVSRLARRHVTVALTGDGGDDVFCGYNRFLVAEGLAHLPDWAGPVLKTMARLVPGSESERTTVARARRLLAVAGTPLSERLVNLHPYFGANLSNLLRPEYRREERRVYEWTEQLLRRSNGCTPLARVLDHSFESYLPYDLLVKADRSSMMHGLELRSPLLDTAVIEYASGLPDKCRRRLHNKKYILRKAFADIIPDSIQHRPKMGFGIPLAGWFRSGPRSIWRERLTAGAKLFQFVEPAFVANLLHEHERRKDDHSHRIWLLLTFESWLNQLQVSEASKALPH
jgi:asparagine synthase (glutamine-hydrolysing)